MNAIDPEEMAGDYVDYLAKQDIERHADVADHAGEMHAALGQHLADLEARVGDVIRQMQAAGNQYWAGVLADALTNKETS